MLREDYIAKSRPNQLTPIIETIVLTFLGILLGFWVSPHLDFFTTQGFSWLIIGPFLSGLRYGFAYALNSSLLLMVLMWILQHYYYPHWSLDVYLATVSSIFFLSIIAGEFRNHSDRKTRKFQVSYNYVDQRLGEITNAFNLLKISHERLAQQAASKSTLRDSLLVIRSHIMRAKSAKSSEIQLNALILRIFSDYGSIQQAGVYTLTDSGKLNTTPKASIGGEFEVNPNDLLLQKTLTTLKTTTLKPDLSSKDEYGNVLLLAIPIVDVFGEIWGLVLVNKMPFRAFRTDNIKLLAILGGHIADLISMTKVDAYSVKDTDLQYFILQIKRCMDDAKAFALASSVVSLQVVNQKKSHEITQLIMSGQRGLDSAWSIKNRLGEQCIFILLPLTDFDGVEGYKIRLQAMLREHYGYQTLNVAEVNLFRKDLISYESLQELMFSLFELLNVDESLLTHQNYGD